MGKWATILKYDGKAINNSATRAAGKSIGSAVIHPQQTMVGFGKAAKTGVVGGGLGYVAWQNVVNDKPVVRTAADILVGEETVDKGMELAGNAADKVNDMASKAGDTMKGVKDSVTTIGETVDGIGNFMSNLSNGKGLDMAGDFLGNLTSGNVSKMGIAGLIAAGVLIFGRFGFLGKIIGALLAMMLIGSNSQSQAPSVVLQGEEETRHGGMRR
jgi:hypothetical protein